VRPFRPFSGPHWIGEAVAYGPHRDGQRPGGPAPSRAELREDLRLMSGHWSLLRLYGSVGPAETLLEIIRADGLDMKVMLGVWIAPEERRDSTGKVRERFPEARVANRRETESAIRLAAAYPEIVLAVSVGNETQIFWSAHRVPAPLVVKHVRQVRAGTTVPVTVADDFNFWNKPESRDMAEEVDFILTHAHPLWNGRALEDAVDWTRSTVEQVRAMHPGRLVVLGETGWATQMIHEGEQGRLIRGRTGEAEQEAFRAALSEWIRRDSVTTFLFEAFDENWKGGSHPGEVEKHWGLFRADRTPKPALRRADRP
jgi:exo-beta-1,3-glucanase (GH17 family)